MGHPLASKRLGLPKIYLPTVSEVTNNSITILRSAPPIKGEGHGDKPGKAAISEETLGKGARSLG